jgi:large subunit ribosomal protein L10
MAKSRNQKSELLSLYKDLIKNNKGYILVHSDSLDTATVTDLKKKLKELDSNYSVIKNTVFKVAIQDSDLPLEALDFSGAAAVISYTDDPTAPAKLIKEIQDETEVMEAIYGIMDGEVLSKERVMELAEIPSREVLLARLVGAMNGPLTGFMNAATGNVRGFTTILQKLSEK